MSHKGSFFSIFHNYQMQAVSDIAGLFLRIEHLRHLFEDADHFLMSVNSYLSFILSLFHVLTDHSDHPDDSHDMIYMFVCHKDLTHIHPVKSGMFQLCKQSVSTAAVNQQVLIPIFQYKTCIITLCDHCISCSQHCNIHKNSGLTFTYSNVFSDISYHN